MIENLNRHQRARALFERISALQASARAAALAEAFVGDDSLQDDVAAWSRPTQRLNRFSNAVSW